MPTGISFQVYFTDTRAYQTDWQTIDLPANGRRFIVSHRADCRTLRVEVEDAPTLNAFATRASLALYSGSAPAKEWSSAVGEFMPHPSAEVPGGKTQQLVTYCRLDKVSGALALESALHRTASTYVSHPGSVARLFLLAPDARSGLWPYSRRLQTGELMLQHVHTTGRFPDQVTFRAPGVIALRAVDADGSPLPWVEASIARAGEEPCDRFVSTDEGYCINDAALTAGCEYVLRLWSNSRDPDKPDREVRFIARAGATDLGAIVLPAYGR
jgi:hypothetical protein